MSFQEGMRFGANALQQGRDNARQAKLDLQAEEERGLRMEGLRRQNTREANTDTAVQNYQTLSRQGGLRDEDRAALGTRYGIAPDKVNSSMGGMGIPYDPEQVDMSGPVPVPANMARRNMLGARQGIAAASGNVAAMAGLEAEGRGLDTDERFLALQQRLGTDPEFRRQVTSTVNLKSSAISVIEPQEGSDGITRLVVVKPDGQAKEVPVSEAQLSQLVYANALMQENPQQAMQLMAAVDTDVAEAVARTNAAQRQDNGNQVDVFNANSRAEDQRLDRDAAAGRHQDNMKLQREEMSQRERLTNAGIAARGAGGRGGRGGADDAEPGQKFTKSDLGDFWQDQNGRPVAKYDPNAPGGMVPFEPNPMSNPRVAQQAERSGIRTVAGEVGGRIMWGFVAPNGSVYETLEEAAGSADASRAMQTTRTKPSNEAARRTGVPVPQREIPLAP